MIPKEFWAEVPDKVAITVSGGVDSTYTALQFHKRGFECLLIHNETGLSLPKSRKTLQALVDYTGWKLVTTPTPDNWMKVLKESFANIPLVYSRKSGVYDRSFLKCCNELKKKPSKALYKTLPKEMAIVMSIAPIESTQRRFRLLELRKKGSFSRMHTGFNGRHHLYPLRDAGTKMERLTRERYCQKILGFEVCASGCRLCPILLIFKMHDVDPKRWARSRLFALKLGGIEFCGDSKRLDEYLGVNDIAPQ